MKQSSLWVLVLLYVQIFSFGCAVQRYGRMMPVVPSERKNLTCAQIAMEIEKCNVFINDVTAQNKKFTGGDIIAFLGDFGIGDSWEVNDAIASATRRLSELEELKEEKCINTSRKPETATTISPAASNQAKALKSAATQDFFTTAGISDSNTPLKTCSKCGRTIARNEAICMTENGILCPECFTKKLQQKR